MPDTEDMTETQLWDGSGGTALVKVGELVELLPTSPDKPDGERGRYLSHRHAEFMLEFLEAPGPYAVTSIYRWPCGRVEIGLKIPGRGPSAKAHDFMPARQEGSK